MTSVTAEIPAKFCSTIKTGSTYCESLTRGEVCCLRLSSFFLFNDSLKTNYLTIYWADFSLNVLSLTNEPAFFFRSLNQLCGQNQRNWLLTFIRRTDIRNGLECRNDD